MRRDHWQAMHADTSARWQHTAQAVTITRDDWGIAHVHGKTNADAVFGMIYAQAEDDFPRIETNYLNAMGRLAEAEGRSAIWHDLRMQLFIDPAAMKAAYADSPDWLRQLMDAWADGLNYYLHTHPHVRPRILRHFEPWMALTFSEGSIGGDITRVSVRDLARFYGDDDNAPTVRPAPATWAEPTGSNGIAIAPSLTADSHALLLINPHVTFYFRTELHMSSDEGLDAYGAATWGQFFLYQGFNQHLGWMHTSSGVDAIDEFAETMMHDNGRLCCRHGDQWLPVARREITVRYQTTDGRMASCSFTGYYTRHGPIVRKTDGHWIAISLMQRPLQALQQSWLRMLAEDLSGYRKISELAANSSNNTLYADDQGHIAFFMPPFVPKRDDRFDYTRPVDGSDPNTAWQGPTPPADLPDVIDPPNGWVMNTNDWPWSAAGDCSPKSADYPRYMDQFGPNPRGEHATQLLTGATNLSVSKLIDIAFDTHLPGFVRLLPVLLADYDALPASDPLHTRLAGPVRQLRHWDCHFGSASIPTTLAVVWGDMLWNAVSPRARAKRMSPHDYMVRHARPQTRLNTMHRAIDRLERDFGRWNVAWGEVNRFQRLDNAIHPHFDDSQPSLPVPFVSSRWGCLAAFETHAWPNTRCWYGNSGNSFVAIIDFGGPRVEAHAVRVGGQGSTSDSPHFTDQAQRYIDGNLRRVYFWPDQLDGHIASRYHPGLTSNRS